MDTTRACCVQMPHGATLEENLDRARTLVGQAAEAGARLVLLPEYFFAVFPGGTATEGSKEPDSRASRPPAAVPAAPRIRALMQDASRARGIVVSGNVIEARGSGFANVGLVYDSGRLVLEQDKIHPMPREAGAGVVGGTALRAAQAGAHRVGMLVCADILYPEASQVLALQDAEVLLNPVMSPWRGEDDGREARVAMYVARAYDARAFVLKAAGYKEGAIAGRSLITAPWGVLARAKADFAEELLFADLDFARLAAFREKQKAFPARRPEAYRDLL